MKRMISVRLSDDVIQALELAAQSTSRTRSALVELKLRAAFDLQPAKRSAAKLEAVTPPKVAEQAPEGREVAKQGIPEKVKMCKKHPGQIAATCSGVSCRQERADREARQGFAG